MNVERVALWIDRLMDPRSKQCTGAFRKNDAMCAIGHGCDVTGLAEWMPAKTFGKSTERGITVYQYDVPSGRGHGIFVPPEVCEWYGLDPNEAVSKSSIFAMNDLQRLTLSEIADVLEDEWPEVAEYRRSRLSLEASQIQTETIVAC